MDKANSDEARAGRPQSRAELELWGHFPEWVSLGFLCTPSHPTVLAPQAKQTSLRIALLLSLYFSCREQYKKDRLSLPLLPSFSPAMPSASRKQPPSSTSAPYLFAQPGVAFASSSSNSPSTRSSPYSQPSSAHTRSDSSGHSSALPVNSASSSAAALLAQRSNTYLPSSASDMPAAASHSHNVYSPRSSRDATGAPLLSSSYATSSYGSHQDGVERLSSGPAFGSSTGWAPGASTGMHASSIGGGRGSISSQGSAGTSNYTPRAAAPAWAGGGSVTSHSSVTQKYALGEDPSQWARTGSPEPDGTSSSPPLLFLSPLTFSFSRVTC